MKIQLTKQLIDREFPYLIRAPNSLKSNLNIELYNNDWDHEKRDNSF